MAVSYIITKGSVRSMSDTKICCKVTFKNSLGESSEEQYIEIPHKERIDIYKYLDVVASDYDVMTTGGDDSVPELAEDEELEEGTKAAEEEAAADARGGGIDGDHPGEVIVH